MNYFKTAQKLTCWIPIKPLRIALRTGMVNFAETIEAKKIIKNYPKIRKKLQEKIQRKEKIKVAFYLMSDSGFQTDGIYEQMLENNIFEPFFVIIPDVLHGQDYTFSSMDKAYKKYSSKYKNVYKSYDEEKKEYKDFTSNTDIAFFNNPYEVPTHELYTIKYNIKKGILPLYVSYGFMSDYYARTNIMNLFSLNTCWKVFADTEYNYEEYKKYTNMKGKNTVLTGYAKMDGLSKIEKRQRSRKKIIIAPHHTVAKPDFPLSNFLTYCDFFLELPKIYPDIDFVFRPHPGLFLTLTKEELWGKKKVEEYIGKITQYSNVEYQNGGNYFDTFVNSDGIIHDCSSFMLEYLYTDNPCCYMLRDEKEEKRVFTQLGQNVLEHYYKAYNKEQIIKFIDDVVIKGNDTKKEARLNFANKYIKLNYPNASKIIVQHIQKCLTCEENTL